MSHSHVAATVAGLEVPVSDVDAREATLRDAMPAAFGNDKRGIRRELRHFLLMLVPTLFALV